MTHTGSVLKAEEMTWIASLTSADGVQLISISCSSADVVPLSDRLMTSVDVVPLSDRLMTSEFYAQHYCHLGYSEIKKRSCYDLNRKETVHLI